MSILSLEFLVFAAGVVLLYYCLPLKIRWTVLLAGSAAYMALAGWQSIAHLSAVALVMWGGGLVLQRKKSKGLLGLLLILDLGAMVFLKYYPSFSGAALILPLGLSYFTFQSAGYLIDVYRGKAEAQKNPLKAWLFIGYFPQLAQGPISTWKELGGQLLTGHRFDPDAFVSGCQLLLWGYFKKMVIADRLAKTTDALLQGGNLPGWFILGGVILYTVRLYLDFSGGMDVIRGLSRTLGIELPENFRRPFFSKSVAEYWRRWHITLGAWFRSYLLYPLTTCRAGIALGKIASKAFGKKTGRTLPSALATLLVFLLIGIWHTANWNAVVYGAYFGLVMGVSMLLEPLWKTLRATLSLPKDGWMTPVRLVRTWALILLAQYFAFTPNPDMGLSLLQGTFRAWDFSGFAGQATAVMAPLEWLIAGSGCLIVLIIDLLCEKKIDVCGGLAKTHFYIRWPVLLLLILAIVTFGVYGTGYDGAAFLYTQF
ncbi:MAG: MBOAT family protein [Clostridia bacterium]|nr:MBOAT family protein [Clostridia bacterium]